jgi:hypothetical protein
MTEQKPNLTIDSPTHNPLRDEANLIDRFLIDVEKSGLVGEKNNAATTFLCATSARLPQPLHLTVCGESSSGKNFLLSAVANFIPDEFKKFSSGFTPKALMHAEEDEFRYKAIFIAEYEGAAKADYAIRTMQSEGMIEWDYVDTAKGIQKKTNRVRGPAAFLQATTRSVLHPENETRLLFIGIDGGHEQTKAILKRQAERSAGSHPPEEQNTTKLWHDFLRSLKQMNVIVPFAEALAEHFPSDRVRSRRDFPKLLSLIENSAFLHQYKRKQEDDGIIVATAEDYLNAKPLFENCFATSPDSVVEKLVAAGEKLGTKNGTFHVCDLIEKTGWGKSKVYAVLERAEELGCIGETETRGLYRFIRSSGVPPLELPETV